MIYTKRFYSPPEGLCPKACFGKQKAIHPMNPSLWLTNENHPLKTFRKRKKKKSGKEKESADGWIVFFTVGGSFNDNLPYCNKSCSRTSHPVRASFFSDFLLFPTFRKGFQGG